MKSADSNGFLAKASVGPFYCVNWTKKSRFMDKCCE